MNEEELTQTQAPVLAVALAEKLPKAARAGVEPQEGRVPAVDLLISRATAPVCETFLLEESPFDKPGKSEYRLNFCGGTVR